ncbi:S26 family signal peptidase [Rhodococcus sp. NPDC055112]
MRPPERSSRRGDSNRDRIASTPTERRSPWPMFRRTKIAAVAPQNRPYLVKRVVAVSGQTVKCRPGDEGVKVDWKTLVEPYVDSRTSPDNAVPCKEVFFGPVARPEDSVCVKGDNRTSSKDSIPRSRPDSLVRLWRRARDESR